MPRDRVLVSIVTYQSGAYIARCLDALADQNTDNFELAVVVRDNASTDGTADAVRAWCEDNPQRPLKFEENCENLGFSAAHNQNVAAFLASSAAYLLVLNPDIRLARTAVGELVAGLERMPKAAAVCPCLYRADENLEPVAPLAFDSTGMVLTPALRHFDRGSQVVDRGQYQRQEAVFGASGACVLFRRSAVQDLLLRGETRDADIVELYPQLAVNREQRPPLFDEGFFAYREDADLSWRARILGWECWYIPTAVGYHKRVVLPERRPVLPAELNLLGVRNRFLLQVNNFSFRKDCRSIIPGLLFRNLVVIAGVLLRERSSLPAFRQLFVLLPRAVERRKLLFARARAITTKAGEAL